MISEYMTAPPHKAIVGHLTPICQKVGRDGKEDLFEKNTHAIKLQTEVLFNGTASYVTVFLYKFEI